MVSQGSPPNPNSHNLHQFLISDSNSSPNQFVNQHFHSHGAGSSYPQSLGLLPSIQSLGERISRSIDLVHAPLVTEESELNHSRHFLGVSNESNNHPQERLSLSLDSGTLVPPVQYRQRSLIPNVINPSYVFSGEETREVCNAGLDRLSGNYSFTDTGFASSSTPFDQSSSNFYGTEPYGIGVRNSKYLKAAQSLLEEVVSIGGKEVESSNEKYVRRLSREDKRGSLRLRFELKAELCHNELLSMEKHELQARIADLIALLEEIERRFEQYYCHMEEMVSSFEVIAGLAGKSYTALALQAMSRHFCTLRDAIISQIYETRRKLSLEMPRISTGLSQMSLFGQETARHNRIALQQLGMIQSPRQTWRPIRGLPETSVAILRSWLFEHFLNPYPNDSEKLVLASQTGLTKNQVSNWFINARVRLWKPMIEEMYKEEFEGLVD